MKRNMKKLILMVIEEHEPIHRPDIERRITYEDWRDVSKALRSLERAQLIRFIPGTGWVLELSNYHRFCGQVRAWYWQITVRAHDEMKSCWSVLKDLRDTVPKHRRVDSLLDAEANLRDAQDAVRTSLHNRD